MSLVMSSTLLGVAGEALPPFDAKTITGDELVKLIWTAREIFVLDRDTNELTGYHWANCL